MKRQIRLGVFETNSSSTHSITMCSKSQFEDWQNGKLLFNEWEHKFIKPSELDKVDYPEDYHTYGEWYEDDYLETYQKGYTTENGDAIVAFGKYGYDG